MAIRKHIQKSSSLHIFISSIFFYSENFVFVCHLALLLTLSTMAFWIWWNVEIIFKLNLRTVTNSNFAKWNLLKKVIIQYNPQRKGILTMKFSQYSLCYSILLSVNYLVQWNLISNRISLNDCCFICVESHVAIYLNLLSMSYNQTNQLSIITTYSMMAIWLSHSNCFNTREFSAWINKNLCTCKYCCSNHDWNNWFNYQMPIVHLHEREWRFFFEWYSDMEVSIWNKFDLYFTLLSIPLQHV